MEERVICSLKSYSSFLFSFQNKTGKWRKWSCSYYTAQTHQHGFDLNHFIFLSQPIRRWILTPSFISGVLHTVLCEKGMLSVMGFLISKLNSNSCHRKCPSLRHLITRKAAWQPWPIYDCTVNRGRSVVVDLNLSFLDSENITKKTIFVPPHSSTASGLWGQNDLEGPSPGPLHISPGSVCPHPWAWCPVAEVKLLWLTEASVSKIKWPRSHVPDSLQPSARSACKAENKEKQQRRKRAL